MDSRKFALTDYGMDVRIRLLRLGKTGTWLAKRIAEEGDCFMDQQYLWKLLTGQEGSRKKVSLINQILSEEEAKQKESA